MIERLQCCYISPDDGLTAPRPASVPGNTRDSLALPRAQQGPRASCSKAWRDPGIAFRLNRLYANKLRFSPFYVTKRPFLHHETSRCSRRNGPYWLRRQPQLPAGMHRHGAPCPLQAGTVMAFGPRPCGLMPTGDGASWPASAPRRWLPTMGAWPRVWLRDCD